MGENLLSYLVAEILSKYPVLFFVGHPVENNYSIYPCSMTHVPNSKIFKNIREMQDEKLYCFMQKCAAFSTCFKLIFKTECNFV